MAREHAPVLVEVRPVGVGAPYDHSATLGERVGDGSQVEERVAEGLPRADRKVLVVEEECDAFVVSSHVLHATGYIPVRAQASSTKPSIESS